MSITAKVSILHRISGVLLVLAIPFLLFILHKSLTSSSTYEALYGTLSSPLMKLIYLILVWAFMQHTCAGVRFLFLDVDKGIDIKCAKATARLVLVVSIILTAVFGVLVW
jgi:succinate dehydrogenase / fumarate reductase cytochrome b subunit